MRTNNFLSIYVPGLLGPLPGRVPPGAITRQPALESWLAKGRKANIDWTAGSAPYGIGESYNIDDLLPPQQSAAALAWLADGGDPGSDCWARVMPVCLSLEGPGARLLAVDLAENEIEQLYAAVAGFFESYGLSLMVSDSGRWFLKGAELPPGRTDPRHLPGGRVDYLIPRSPNNLAWSRIWTELEMLLFNQPVNMQRQERGLPPVNSLWIWGVGRCPQSPMQLPWGRVASTCPEWRGWSLWAGGEAGDDAQHAVVCPNQPTLVHCSRAAEAISAEDWGGWLEAVEYVDSNLIGPALKLLRGRQSQRPGWSRLVLWVNARAAPVVLEKAYLWRFWRRILPFESWLIEES